MGDESSTSTAYGADEESGADSSMVVDDLEEAPPTKKARVGSVSGLAQSVTSPDSESDLSDAPDE